MSVVAFTVSAGTVAAIVATRSQPDELSTIGCWNTSSAPQPSEVKVVEWDGTDPVAVCGDVWDSNGFDTIETSEAPPLAACVNDAGAVVVVPGAEETVCATVGLTVFDVGVDPDIDATRVAAEQIEATLTEAACLPLEAAATAAEEILAENGLADWSVSRPDPIPNADVCITASIDAAARTVFLVPGV